MAHIRYATTGGVSLENVHPFSRELWGIQWTFAHNGQVPKFDDSRDQEEQPLLGQTTISTIHYHPIGETDSEAVFCAILNALKARKLKRGCLRLGVLSEVGCLFVVAFDRERSQRLAACFGGDCP